jgi:hypothetical protein
VKDQGSKVKFSLVFILFYFFIMAYIKSHLKYTKIVSMKIDVINEYEE